MKTRTRKSWSFENDKKTLKSFTFANKTLFEIKQEVNNIWFNQKDLLKSDFEESYRKISKLNKQLNISKKLLNKIINSYEDDFTSQKLFLEKLKDTEAKILLLEIKLRYKDLFLTPKKEFSNIDDWLDNKIDINKGIDEVKDLCDIFKYEYSDYKDKYKFSLILAKLNKKEDIINDIVLQHEVYYWTKFFEESR